MAASVASRLPNIRPDEFDYVRSVWRECAQKEIDCHKEERFRDSGLSFVAWSQYGKEMEHVWRSLLDRISNVYSYSKAASSFSWSFVGSYHNYESAVRLLSAFSAQLLEEKLSVASADQHAAIRTSQEKVFVMQYPRIEIRDKEVMRVFVGGLLQGPNEPEAKKLFQAERAIFDKFFEPCVHG